MVRAGRGAIVGLIAWLSELYGVSSLLCSASARSLEVGAVESIAVSGAWLCALSSLGPSGALAKAGAGLARGQGNL